MKVVEKPWGRETWWAVTPSYVGKIIEVRAGHSLSLQYHREKLESMYFLRGRGRLLVGDEEKEVAPGLAVTIPPGTVHRIWAEEDLQIVEVSTPQVEDVVRIEDAYGRTADAGERPR
ncbi:MAG: cupin domain-containing protein [Bacillota bacterium]|nr:cupin domain-containing protein [Bacillota bacterium]